MSCGDSLFGQAIAVGHFIFDEYIRRSQLIDEYPKESSIMRPFQVDYRDLFYEKDSILRKKIDFGLVPITNAVRLNTSRPYGWGDFSMIPSVGIQNLFSTGFFLNSKYWHFQIQPEFVISQNKPFFGFPDTFSPEVSGDRFLFWSLGDYPELFGSGTYSKVFFGQSTLAFRLNNIEISVSSKNIWWGPGQRNSLTFSNNAPGFPYLSLNTTSPINSFLGKFEFQLIIGKLSDSGFTPSQSKDLNHRFFNPFSGDWRYLNALMVNYSPKFLQNLNVGFSRTFQRYSENEGRDFSDLFPVFEGLQKINLFTNGNAVEYDANGYDQQFTIFTRYFNNKANAELYFEFGRRDHALNWRELILNPEHARAYLFGFNKLFRIKNEKFIQFRGEVTQQQESINRYIRYLGLKGNLTWHIHHQARGFANFGQPLGVGIGSGSNLQSLEVSLVEKFNKIGLIFERLENHQDFYYRAFGQQNEYKPWIDLSMGFLFDHRWDNFLLSSKLQLINGHNYQWQLDPASTSDFPKGYNLFSIHSQINLIYLPKFNNFNKRVKTIRK